VKVLIVTYMYADWSVGTTNGWGARGNILIYARVYVQSTNSRVGSETRADYHDNDNEKDKYGAISSNERQVAGYAGEDTLWTRHKV